MVYARKNGEPKELQLDANDRLKVATAPSGVAPVDRSGAIAAGGVAQQLMAANAARVGYSIQNQSAGPLYVNELDVAAVQSQPSLKIDAGEYFENPPGGCATGAISIIGATLGQAFTAREW